jgi:cobalt-zinc-cadmium resistance protein CzcA
LNDQNPQLGYLKAQSEMSRFETKVEKSRLAPGISVGYIHPLLIDGYNPNDIERDYTGESRQAGFQVGLTVPLLFGAQQGKIQTAKLKEKAAESGYSYYKSGLQSQFYELMQQYEKFAAGVQYFEQSGLAQAELILDNANRGFRAGNIGYVEYLQALDRAVSIRQDYIETLSGYNETVIEIEYLTGEK